MLNTKVRFRLFDLILLVLIAAFVGYIWYRLKVNLKYTWHWESMPKYLVRRDPETGKLVTNYLLHGLFTTLKLSIWSTIFAIILGTIMGIFRTSKSLFLQLIGRTYVELIRNLPPLVLIFIFYFFLSSQIMPLLGIETFFRTRTPEAQKFLSIFFDDVRLVNQFFSGLATLSFFEGAYITEIVRSGINSIERGQREASYALGLSKYDQMRYIIMPQALKRILPPLAGQFISTIKDSSIVAAISIQELTFQGMQLATSTHHTFEVWILITVMYLILTLTLSTAVNRLEIRMQKKGGY